MAIEFGNVIAQTIDDISNNYEKLKRLISEYDIRVSQIYHEIETKNLNASEGFKKYKELQFVLRERRVVKHEFSSMRALLVSFDIEATKSKIHKTLKNSQKYEEGNQIYREGWNVSIEDIIKAKFVKI
ncbi:hypothetical protein [Paenibacillus polymyxa]|uniref:hypothetical protein n=1 Tax=Paenibacillus polymyxa TaxID=1406 RepID=UPI00287FC7EE|nr:hypothetical protein [Paenibacillus polymyxa]